MFPICHLCWLGQPPFNVWSKSFWFQFLFESIKATLFDLTTTVIYGNVKFSWCGYGLGIKPFFCVLSKMSFRQRRMIFAVMSGAQELQACIFAFLYFCILVFEFCKMSLRPGAADDILISFVLRAAPKYWTNRAWNPADPQNAGCYLTKP